MRVLVVDDDPAILRLVEMTLTSAEFEVTTAENGEAALQRVGEQPFDVIVLDLEMPVMDGRTFYRALRAIPDGTPVLILSAYNVLTAQRELDTDAALSKPFDPNVLVERLIELASSPTGERE